MISCLVELSTGKYPVTIEEFRRKFWNTSFPENLTREVYITYGYDIVFISPNANSLKEGRPKLTKKGYYIQTWES